MTNEQAIKAIKEHCYFANLIPVAKEALDMAIKALEQNEELQKENEDFQNYIDKANYTNSQLIQLIEKYKMNRDTSEDCVSRAEYIKKEDAIPYLTKYIPSVEAVERSKVDEAIEEIDYGIATQVEEKIMSI